MDSGYKSSQIPVRLAHFIDGKAEAEGSREKPVKSHSPGKESLFLSHHHVKPACYARWFSYHRKISLALVCSALCTGSNIHAEFKAAQGSLVCPGVRKSSLPQQGVHLLSCAWTIVSALAIHSSRIFSSFINLESNKINSFS